MNIQALIHPWLCDCNRSNDLLAMCKHSNKRPLRHQRALKQSKSRSNFKSSTCLLPVQRQINYHHYASLIQKIWRGWRGQLLAEIRHFQLFQLEEKARSTYFYGQMIRLQQILIQWHQLAIYPRQLKATLTFQSIWRGHIDRLYVKRKRKMIHFLIQAANQRILLFCIQKWFRNVYNIKRIRKLKYSIKRFQQVVYRRALCRKTILQMYQIARFNKMEYALLKYYKWMLHKRWLEHRARKKIAIRRWCQFSSYHKHKNKRTLTIIIRYWKALVVLTTSRRDRKSATTMVQTLYRGWHIRTLHYRSARRLQCFGRIILAKYAYHRAYIYRMYVNIYYTWKKHAPIWKINRIKREKRRLYRNAVQRRHRRRARRGKASPLSPSFDEVIIGMEHALAGVEIESKEQQLNTLIQPMVERRRRKTIKFVYKYWKFLVSKEFKEIRRRQKKLKLMKMKMKKLKPNISTSTSTNTYTKKGKKR